MRSREGKKYLLCSTDLKRRKEEGHSEIERKNIQHPRWEGGGKKKGKVERRHINVKFQEGGKGGRNGPISLFHCQEASPKQRKGVMISAF